MNTLFKRIMAAIVAAGLTVSCFAACGKNEEDNNKNDSVPETVASEDDNSVEDSAHAVESEESGTESAVSEEADAEVSIVDESSEDKGGKPQRPDGERPDRPGRPDRPNGGRPSNGGTPLNELPDDSDITTDEVDTFFNNSVFIGYSIMMHFGRYVGEWRQDVDESILGEALFCAGVSMGFTTDRIQTPDTPENSLPLFQGQAYNFADLPAATGCDTLYIGLSGYSDLKRAEADETCVFSAYNEAVMGVERIKAKNPDLKIVLLSCTYNTEVFDGLTVERCTNAQVYEYNNLVLDYCNDNGIDFIDVSTMLTDSKGLLVEDYSTDGEYHIVKNAYYLWVEALRDYAKQKQEGTWKNIDDMPALPAV